jgi:hypothetical protein
MYDQLNAKLAKYEALFKEKEVISKEEKQKLRILIKQKN